MTPKLKTDSGRLDPLHQRVSQLSRAASRCGGLFPGVRIGASASGKETVGNRLLRCRPTAGKGPRTSGRDASDDDTSLGLGFSPVLTILFTDLADC